MKLTLICISFVILFVLNGCNVNDDGSYNDTSNITPESYNEFISNLDPIIVQSQLDIKTWYKYTVPGVNRRGKIARNESKFIALIDPISPGPKEIPISGSRVIYSEDGLNWNEIDVELPGIYSSIIYSNTYFYAVGKPIENQLIGSIARSIDGYIWEEVLVSQSNLFDIIITNDTFVAVGLNGSIITSKDGLNWTEKSIGNYSLYNAVYGDKVLITGDAQVIFSSNDTNTWSLLKNDIQAVGVRHSLYVNGLYLLFSNDFTLIYDGNNFNPIRRESNLKEVVYENQFLNVEEEVSTSTDGITWTKIAILEVIDENTTNININESFISGSDIIFVENF